MFTIKVKKSKAKRSFNRRLIINMKGNSIFPLSLSLSIYTYIYIYCMYLSIYCGGTVTEKYIRPEMFLRKHFFSVNPIMSVTCPLVCAVHVIWCVSSPRLRRCWSMDPSGSACSHNTAACKCSVWNPEKFSR